MAAPSNAKVRAMQKAAGYKSKEDWRDYYNPDVSGRDVQGLEHIPHAWNNSILGRILSRSSLDMNKYVPNPAGIERGKKQAKKDAAKADRKNAKQEQSKRESAAKGWYS